MGKIIICSIICLPLVLAECDSTEIPESYGELNSNYTYVPIDPLGVFSPCIEESCWEVNGATRPDSVCDLLTLLPDQAVRLAIGEIDQSGGLTYGPVKIGVKNKSYKVVLDYINVDIAQLPVKIQRIISSGSKRGSSVSLYDQKVDEPTRIIVQKTLFSEFKKTERDSSQQGNYVVIPVYIGVGLRLTASVTVIKGTADLSSLGALSAEAAAGKIVGTLVIQSMGITGKNVSNFLPIPSEINQTTIQAAILALGSIKAVLYDRSGNNTIITPRVIGIYNPTGGGKEVISGVISVLAEHPINWPPPCNDKAENN